MTLVLSAVDVEGPARWRWLLTDKAGTALLDHKVDLGTGSAEYAAGTSQVSLVYDVRPGASARSAAKEPVGDRLRILALYSLPARQMPLALRRERCELARTVQSIASRAGAAIELRILQYGVTRKRLRATAEDYPGWDILQVSGHGLEGRVILENDDGTSDEITGDALVDILRPARRRLKLAMLSVCHSGADGAAEVLNGRPRRASMVAWGSGQRGSIVRAGPNAPTR